MTAACEIFGRHADHQGPGACRGTIVSFTTAHLTGCACPCHQDPVLDHDELEAIAEAEADRRLDQVLTDELFGAEL
jgi:hypothetical protein